MNIIFAYLQEQVLSLYLFLSHNLLEFDVFLLEKTVFGLENETKSL
jgi:hypothetical protein